MKDDQSMLSQLLHSWRQRRIEPTAEFNRNVWNRINQEGRTHSSLWRFPTTLRATACWAAAISAFSGSAAAVAYDSLTRDDRMAAEHARAIDPFQIVAAPHTIHRH